MIVTCRVKDENVICVDYLKSKDVNISRYINKCLRHLAIRVFHDEKLQLSLDDIYDDQFFV